MSYRIAPAAASALKQATLLWPRRSTVSDGLVGDDAHRARTSFHNPSYGDGVWKDDGTVLAFDLTYDPAGGCDAHALARELVRRNDQRVHEAISMGRIWTRARAAEGWRPYTGTNLHNHHAHISVAWAHRNDTSPWWIASEPAEEELDMDEATVRRIIREEITKAIGLVLRGDDTHPDNLKAVRADIAKLPRT